MFSSFNKLKGAVTLFNAPNSPVSKSLAAFIKNTYPRGSQNKFTVEVTDSVPTPEQWRIISDSKSLTGDIRSEISKFAASANANASTDSSSASTSNNVSSSESLNFNKYPILVDWDSGKVAIDNEQLAKDILKSKLD